MKFPHIPIVEALLITMSHKFNTQTMLLRVFFFPSTHTYTCDAHVWKSNAYQPKTLSMENEKRKWKIIFFFAFHKLRLWIILTFFFFQNSTPLSYTYFPLCTRWWWILFYEWINLFSSYWNWKFFLKIILYPYILYCFIVSFFWWWLSWKLFINSLFDVNFYKSVM